MNDKILKTIQDIRQNSKKRNFSQSMDLVIGLKEFDAKKAENKIDEFFILPHGRGRDPHIVIFADNANPADADVINSAGIDALSKNKRAAKKLANSADILFGEPKLMPVVAKALGTLLGPRGKIPKVLVGNADTLVKEHKKATRVRVKDMPMIQCVVGSDAMKDEDLVENVVALMKHIEKKLPGGRSNIGRVMLKTTMGKPVRVEGL